MAVTGDAEDDGPAVVDVGGCSGDFLGPGVVAEGGWGVVGEGEVEDDEETEGGVGGLVGGELGEVAGEALGGGVAGFAFEFDDETEGGKDEEEVGASAADFGDFDVEVGAEGGGVEPLFEVVCEVLFACLWVEEVGTAVGA